MPGMQQPSFDSDSESAPAIVPETEPDALPETVSKPVQVMVRSESKARRRGFLGRLVSIFRLDVNGDSLLGRRARLELELVAFVLLLIFLFDLAAWSLLLNTLLHTEILAVDPWSAVAIVIGLVFATMVVLYERQFYTADVWSGWSRVRGPMAARIAVVIASAICTAQPVELLFFKEAIAQRAHEEGIRLELVTRQRKADRIESELNEIQRNLASVSELIKGQMEAIEYKESKKARDEAVAEQAQLEAAEARAVGNIDHWQRIIKERQAQVDELESQAASKAGSAEPSDVNPWTAQLAAARQRVKSGEASLRIWRERLAAARAGLREVEKVLPRLDTDIDENWKRLTARRAEVEAALRRRQRESESGRERIEGWIRQLRTVKPGDREPIREKLEVITHATAATPAGDEAVPATTSSTDGSPSAGASGHTRLAAVRPVTDRWKYRFPRYDFFRQLRVLKDLREGNPPLWEGVSPEKAAILARDHGLEHVRRCETGIDALGNPCDTATWRHHIAQTRVYMWSWWIVYAVALIIPALVLAMKWLMTPELKAYYSTDCQVVAGNADAISVREIGRIAREGVDTRPQPARPSSLVR